MKLMSVANSLIGLFFVPSVSRPPELPDTFSASILFRVPFVGLDLPIEIDSDASSNMQLVDFLGGMHTQFVSLDAPNGLKSVFNISERVCIEEEVPGPGSSEGTEAVNFIRVFPDLKSFELVGQTVVRGLQVDEYVKNVSRPGESEAFYYDPKLSIPVRWIMHSRDEIFNSHLDEYIVDYISVRPLTWSISRPRECKENIVKLGPSRSSSGHSVVHKLKREYDKFPMGYIPRTHRPKIVVYGDRVSVADLPNLEAVSVPVSFDWRDNNGSPKPKDQVMCGSCYAFSVIGAIESQLMIQKRLGNDAQVLSEQFILDCGWSDGVSSCSGGNQEEVGRVLLERYDGFIPYDNQYGRYMSTYSYCKNITGFGGVKIDGWVSLPTQTDNESIKKFLIHYGLLSVSINAVDEIVFHTPDSEDGVIRTNSCKHTKLDDLNHAVNLVGFGTSERGEYWILRNSWSTHWGDSGYLKVEMGDRDCGVSLDVSFPIIHGIHSLSPERAQTTAITVLS
jgi:C1A family cysteine protease